MIRVIVVDDHTVVREGLCRVLSDQFDIEVVGAAATAAGAMALLNEGLEVHILLTDMNMPVMNGLELTRQAVISRSGLQVIVLTSFPLLAAKPQALAAGARDCLGKDSELDDLLLAIRATYPA